MTDGTVALLSRSYVLRREADRMAAVLGVTPETLRRRDRKPKLCAIRQVIAAALRRKTGASFAEIGAALGRDHSSIQASCRKIEAEAATDTDLAALLERLTDDPARRPLPHGPEESGDDH